MSELIITDGECLKERLQAENCISFNEALCDETVTYPLFDDAFCKLRATELGVSFQEYVEISVKSLETIKGYERLVLYFGRDMFCMINLIGLLTYLEQIGYKGNIELRLVDEETLEIQATYDIQLGNYTNIYKQVLVEHCLPVIPCFFELQCGIEMYLDMLSDDNEILTYIRENINEENLLAILLERYYDYGYGDTQYKKMIERVRNE